MEEKKKRSSRKSGRLSLTQATYAESSEDNQSEAESVFQSKDLKATTKNQKSDDNAFNQLKQDTFKSPVRTTSSEKKDADVNIHKRESPKNLLKDFCPICQVPLPYLKIPIELHTAHCLIEADVLPPCPDGIGCINISMFHYRDFHHNELASWRCSADYDPSQYLFPAPPKSTKKRPSLSPLSLASRTKKIKTPEDEKVDDPGIGADAAVRKALFQDDQKASVCDIKTSSEIRQPAETTKEVKHNPANCDITDDSFLCDPIEKDVEIGQVKPLKCDVTFEYSDEESSKTNVVGKQSACSVSCLSPSNGEEIQAVCTVSIKAPGGNAQVAATNSPVHVHLLLNESGWEAVQVDATRDAEVKQVDISLCKCARAISLKCVVADPKIKQSSEQKDVMIEHKYSTVLEEIGLKKKAAARKDKSLPSGAHDKVDSLKNKNAQLSIKSFFASQNNQVEQVPLQSNGDLKAKSLQSSKNSVTKTPRILLAGSSASRPLTPIILGGEPSAAKVSTKSSTTETTKPRRPWGNSSTPVPQYKRITDTPFVVDAFKWGAIDGVKAYFLTHFHSDHYMGLRKHFNLPIYCSRITGNLIRLKFGVDPQFIHILEIGEPRILCNVEVEVFDANHCPGSLMFLFRLLDGRCILHVGDFRASTSMEHIPRLRKVDILYLDTTYCDPVYDFPSQGVILEEVVRTAKRHIQQNPRTLFCCGSYTIGKEKVFLNIAEALDIKFYTNKEKAKVLKCLDDKIISNRLVGDRQAQLHVVYMKEINFEYLDTVLKDAGPSYTSLVAFEPTGWTTSKVGSPSILRKTTKGCMTIYAVPYSEHSSFSELRRFVRFVQPRKIQVTVNLGKQRVYQKYFKQWLGSTGGDQASLDTFLNK